MKNLKLDSILLFILIIPFIMTYGIGPGETPFWLFGLIFLAILLYAIFDLGWFHKKEKVYIRFKTFLLWFTIFATIGAAFFSAIVVRHQISPIYNVHDIILQQESALRFMLHGKNPYTATYVHTPMKDWHYSDTEENPALYHFVMQPFYLLFAVPFYLVMGHTIGYFDARVPLFILFFSLLILAQKLIKDSDKSRLFVVLLAYNPAMLGYTLEGRADMFMFTFLFAGFYLLYKKRIAFAGIPIAFAFATKQSIWPLFPLYIAYVYFKTKKSNQTIKLLLPFFVTFFIVVLPFYFWNPKGFIDSTIFYLSGNVAHSYPIAGYGLGAMLHQSGFIKDVHTYYPFWIWQAIVSVPILIWLILWMKKENSIQRLILAYGIFLFIFWYLSRYFNNSHLGYLSMIFLTAYFFPEEKG